MHRHRGRALAAAAVALACTACGRGGSNPAAPGAAATELRLVSVDLDPSGIQQINRPIRFVFNRRVDFASVSASSIAIRAWNGVPAIGDLSEVGGDERVIQFQPRCPLLADLSDAGLSMATDYDVDIVGADESVYGALRTPDGSVLEHSVHRSFATPSNGASAFLDTQPGAPRVLARASASDAIDASYVELGGDATQRLFFEHGANGEATLAPDRELPLSLHADPASRVAFYLAFDQSIDPSAPNLARIAVQFRGDIGAWRPLPTMVEFVDECASNGALVRVAPRGSLPPASDLRVVLLAGFCDLVGQALAADTSELAVLRTEAVTSPLHDQYVEEFTSDALEDATANLGEPHALWRDGELRANDNFAGVGGPGGDFDFEVPPGQVVIFDTAHMLIHGGPDFAPQREQVVEGGALDVRRFKIAANATLRVQGPNPLVILASGDVQIDGLLDISGTSQLGVGFGGAGTFRGPGDTVGSVGGFYTFFLPQPGAPGAAGGGRGGDGHPIAGPNSVAFGGDGLGPLGATVGGGRGGETGWSAIYSADLRRGGGGGGGRLGFDVVNTSSGAGTFDQRRIGLDAERGFDNLLGSNGFVHIGGPPQGGAAGQSSFTDGDPTNDFFGRALDESTGARVEGEWTTPSAGAGGGGGGDDVFSSTTVSLTQSGSVPGQHGGGGGGGAGCVRIVALGAIRVGANGQIRARGGTGGTGGNSFFLDHVGGSGGGGSGGHVILESASKVQFDASGFGHVSVLATGGQGGAGAGNLGGAFLAAQGALETLAAADACSPGYPTTGVNACNGHVDGAGGDGGPGIIQLHLVHGAADVILPAGMSLADICQPPPLCEWGSTHLVPSIELHSRARSKWIALGEGGFDAASDSFEPMQFEFAGTAPNNGLVLENAGEVELAPAILGPSALGVIPSPPYIAHLGRELVIDASEWIGGDLAYFLDRPYLLRHAIVALRSTSAPNIEQRFDVVAAQIVEGTTATLALTVDGDGPRLDQFQSAGTFEVSLHPTWLRAATDGAPDTLPGGATIRVAFQATTATSSGAPDDASAQPMTFDAATLNAAALQHPLRFVRFDVSFTAHAGPVWSAAGLPRPSLDFLRLPWSWPAD